MTFNKWPTATQPIELREMFHEELRDGPPICLYAVGRFRAVDFLLAVQAHTNRAYNYDDVWYTNVEEAEGEINTCDPDTPGCADITLIEL